MAISVLPHRDALGVTPGGRSTSTAPGVTLSEDSSWTHVNPATNEPVVAFATAGERDAQAAVQAARRAFDEGPWPRLAARDRKRILHRMVDLLRDNADHLNRLQPSTTPCRCS